MSPHAAQPRSVRQSEKEYWIPVPYESLGGGGEGAGRVLVAGSDSMSTESEL